MPALYDSVFVNDFKEIYLAGTGKSVKFVTAKAEQFAG
jgi:hypothetical protein